MFFDGMLERSLGQIMAPLAPSESIFFLYLGSALVISMGTYFWFLRRECAARPDGISKGMFGYIFDRSIWLHRSARQDYIFFLVNIIIYNGIVTHFLVSGHVIYNAFGYIFEFFFGVRDVPIFENSALTTLAYTATAVLAIDLTIFLTHYLQHKIAALWHFHAVHHSAEVLTVMTVYRQHPVHLVITGTFLVILSQMAFAGFTYMTLAAPSELNVLNLNVFLFAFFLIGYNLRHSHIWLNYPQMLSYLLISPAQHQTHHSVDPRHFDKNFGFIFAFWDWIFGTLYVPVMYERLQYGISREEANPYSSVVDIYVRPFRRFWCEIRTARSLRRVVVVLISLVALYFAVDLVL